MTNESELLVKEARETAEELIHKATKEADRAWYWFFAPRHWKERKLQAAREYMDEAEKLISSIRVYEATNEASDTEYAREMMIARMQEVQDAAREAQRAVRRELEERLEPTRAQMEAAMEAARERAEQVRAMAAMDDIQRIQEERTEQAEREAATAYDLIRELARREQRPLIPRHLQRASDAEIVEIVAAALGTSPDDVIILEDTISVKLSDLGVLGRRPS